MVRKNNKYVFKMPNGIEINTVIEVDDYYGFKHGKTYGRLQRGWTVDECAANCKNAKPRVRKSFIFNMPDGSVLTRAVDVDRYHDLKVGTTTKRLNIGWTEEECSENKRDDAMKWPYTFNMPNGAVFHNPNKVDKYYGNRNGMTSQRLNSGWTEEDCANNVCTSRGKFEFVLPDDTVLYRAIDVDEYYGLTRKTTSNRLLIGWTVQECAFNSRCKDLGVRFKMPNGKVFVNTGDVDRYYKLESGTTKERIRKGWTVTECAYNVYVGENHVFNMPNGVILNSCGEVDKFYSLEAGTTLKRLIDGWTINQCENGQKSSISILELQEVVRSLIKDNEDMKSRLDNVLSKLSEYE